MYISLLQIRQKDFDFVELFLAATVLRQKKKLTHTNESKNEPGAYPYLYYYWLH